MRSVVGVCLLLLILLQGSCTQTAPLPVLPQGSPSAYPSDSPSNIASDITADNPPDNETLRLIYEHGEELFYSNLVDKDAQNAVSHILLAAGADETDVEEVFAWVDDFNDFVKDIPSLPLEASFVPFDEHFPFERGTNYDVQTKWSRSGKPHTEILCRILVFHLLRDVILAQNLIPEADWHVTEVDGDYSGSLLSSDFEIIQTNPYLNWTTDEIRRYFTVFNPTPLPGTASEADLYGAISNMWAERGVAFTTGRLSLVTVWRQNEEFELAVSAHAAVLAEFDGGLLLLEKTNPFRPYQATIFNHRAEVKAYMLDKLVAILGDGTGTAIVMANGVLLH